MFEYFSILSCKARVPTYLLTYFMSCNEYSNSSIQLRSVFFEWERSRRVLPSKERLLHSSILLHLCVLRIQAPIRRGLRLGRENYKNLWLHCRSNLPCDGRWKRHAECGRAGKACGLSGPWSSFFIVLIYDGHAWKKLEARPHRSVQYHVGPMPSVHLPSLEEGDLGRKKSSTTLLHLLFFFFSTTITVGLLQLLNNNNNQCHCCPRGRNNEERSSSNSTQCVLTHRPQTQPTKQQNSSTHTLIRGFRKHNNNTNNQKICSNRSTLSYGK